MDAMRVVPAGDSALLVEFTPRIAPEINRAAIALARALKRGGGALRDVVIGYCTVTVYFDPLAVDLQAVERTVRTELATLQPTEADDGALLEVPVCYGGEFGPDLAAVAAFANCAEEDVIDLHVATTFRVYMLGFVPGFAYMAEVPQRIAAPRRPSPRAAVPAGSVAIAGGQTGIYPAMTPGGWNIIGRTPLKPYEPARADPFLFKPADRVRFRRMTRVDFDRLDSEWHR
jgi:inhibitor of KinA